MGVRDFFLTTDEIVEILTADNSDGEDELQLDEKDVQILEENINEGNPEVVRKQVTGKDGEDAFVNQTFSEKDKTNDFCIESPKNRKWIKNIKKLKLFNFKNNNCWENYAKAMIFQLMIYFSKSMILIFC